MNCTRAPSTVPATACVLARARRLHDPERVLFGSDFPYAPAPAAGMFTKALDEASGLTDQQLSAINSGNARRLFRNER
ncbi:hypothetical protein DEO23_00645 [Brachybacterium endophyticum]|uniref:Amidohydrolase-related domain-containing protein n=1 Tax=Brachybacterium endophyticum TaxID=2182385 RepID=A0A2U2RMU7_9MICO|nr:amidohydrolase family protein [Brachybacterium endophyticum]PWH07207.1 hypothetical protein DEO23_00645 [Brachybacterium endophyticum]